MLISAPQETDSQFFTPDATFWHDMSSYICASPKSQYDQCYDDASASPDDVIFKVTPRGSRRVRSKEQSPEVILVNASQMARDLSSLININVAKGTTQIKSRANH
jgi:hypothetical protein